MLPSLVLAEAVPVPENHIRIGAAGVTNSAPYEGLDGYVTPMPSFDIRFGNFFMWSEHDEPVIGWDLFYHKRISFSFIATRGRTFLDVDDTADGKDFLYYGLEDKDQAIEAGVLFRFYSRVGLFEMWSVHDVTDVYDGVRSSISMSRPFAQTGQWEITPRVFVKHYSEKFNNYYYAITESETKTGILMANEERLWTAAEYLEQRNTYTPGTAGHFGVDVSIAYNFNEHIQGKLYVAIEKFSGEVETSPIIEDKELTTISVGLNYGF